MKEIILVFVDSVKIGILIIIYSGDLNKILEEILVGIDFDKNKRYIM